MEKRWLLVLAVVLLLVGSLVVGCGGEEAQAPPPSGNGEAANGEDTSEEGVNGGEEAAEVDFDDDPVSLAEGWIVDLESFAKLVKSGTWGMPGLLEINYSSQGSEMVDGVSSEKITLFMANLEDEDESGEFSVWVGKGFEIVKIAADDEVFGADDEDMDELGEEFMMGMFTMFFVPMMFPNLSPFMFGDTEAHASEFAQVLAGQDVPGWEVLSRDSSRQNIGGNRVNVHSVELKQSPWGGGDKPVVFTFGDFGSFKLLLSWQDEEGNTIFETSSITLY